MSQGIHLDERCHLGVVGEIIPILALQGGRHLALGGDEAYSLFLLEHVPHKGQDEELPKFDPLQGRRS
jgi:hypothetical protein